MATYRKVAESPITQGVDESIAYQFDFTPWSASATAPSCVLYNLTAGGTVPMSGTATISGGTVTSNIVSGLLNGYTYRLVCNVTIGANIEGAYVDIVGEL